MHAVQHVFEMQGRVHDGIEWLNATSPNWADSALAFHNWWHLALHQLELGDIPAALDVYDRLVHPKETTVALELVELAAPLGIALRGGNVGTRWAELADCWSKRQKAGSTYSTTCTRCSPMRFRAANSMPATLTALEKSASSTGTKAENVRAVGLPIALAIVAMAAGRPAEALEQLLPIRSRSYRIGGSHAQRDLVQLTESAPRSHPATAAWRGRSRASAPSRSRSARTTGA